jgi:Fic family protein
MSTEAVTTSEIEGEILNRDSVQSSIRRQLGLSTNRWKAGLTGVSPATAARDLADLVTKNALVRAGERRHAYYSLANPLHPVAPVVLSSQGNVE